MPSDEFQLDRVELAPTPPEVSPPAPDRRPHMPEPPPVRLTAIEDVLAIAPAGAERELDDFYVSFLQFERDADADNRLIYRAENFRLILEIREPLIERSDMRAIGVEVRSLVDAESKIIERKSNISGFED